MKTKKLLSVLLSGTMLMTAGLSLPAVPSVQAAGDAGIETFPMSEVKLADPYSVNAFQKEIAYLLSFDNGKLLAGFRDNAGLSTEGASRYDGWENSLIGGHTVGHYLTAVSQAYVNPLATDAQKQALLTKIKGALTSTPISKIGAAMVKKPLKKTLKSFSMEEYGGAPMLGLNGLVIKTHGNSKSIEVKNSILQAVKFTEADISEKIRRNILE